MKPTDEERREVAQKLRESRSFVDGLGRCGMTQNVLDTFERILECVGYETGNVFDFLADLVEPAPERTCVPIVAKVEAVDWEDCYVVECNRCRHSFGGFFDDLEKAERFARSLPVYYQRYCAGCGARVEGAVE